LKKAIVSAPSGNGGTGSTFKGGSVAEPPVALEVLITQPALNIFQTNTKS
jgi:hypothetical protein